MILICLLAARATNLFRAVRPTEDRDPLEAVLENHASAILSAAKTA
jgi:hypothetical protein